MSAVQRITPFLQDIHAPAPLRDLPFWLAWRLETFSGEAKARKVPYYPSGERRHGQQGTPADMAKLTTFAVAREAAIKRGMDGVGFAHTLAGGVVTLDFDGCVRDGVVRPDVLELVENTYAEFSPSGTGIHATFFGPPDVLRNHKTAASGDDFAVEAFSSTGFTTFTGWTLDHVDVLGFENHIAALPQFVIDACQRRFNAGGAGKAFDPDDFMAGHEPKLGLSIERMQELLGQLDPSMPREPWLRVGMALHHECEGDDTGLELWDEWSSDGATYPGTEALRYQWESFKPAAGKRQTTMASVIKMANEAAAQQPTREAVMAKAEAIMAERQDGPRGRFSPVPVFDLTLRPPMEWLIKGVLPKGELAVLFGASGSGKTFVLLDMLFTMALGRDWRGHRSRKGRVVIIAAEGGAGVGKRAEAYSIYHNIDLERVDNVHVITAAPDFLESDDIAEVVAEIRALGDVSVIAIDTLAQVTPGANENASEDMGRALRNLKILHEATGALNLVVHHAGKDLSKGSRGWSGIKGAADVQIEVLRHENGAREILLEKMKDGEDGVRWPFKLEVVTVGVDADNDEVTSCVAVEADPLPVVEDQERKGLKRRGKVETHILEVMTLFPSESTVRMIDLVNKASEMLPEPEDGKRDTRRQLVTRAIRSLSSEKDGPLKVEGNLVVFYE